jgi:exopolysaccharide biosynthesis polyprenyl glycosylphosphotransferase
MSVPNPSLAAVDVQLLRPSEQSVQLASFLAPAEKLMDFLAVLGAIYVAASVYRVLEPQRTLPYTLPAVLICAAGFALLMIVLLERHGGYRASVSLLSIRETERILRVTLQAFLIALLATYFCGAPVSRVAFCLTFGTVPLFLTVEKWQMHSFETLLRSRGYGSRRAVILGTGAAGRRIYSALLRSPKFGVDPVAFVDDGAPSGTTEIYDVSHRGTHSARVLPAPLCPELFRQLDASVLVIATATTDHQSLLETIAKVSEAGVNTYFAANDFLEPGYWVDFAELDGIMLAHVSRGANRVVYEFGKRLLDLFVAIILLPVLAAAAPIFALVIKVTSPGPVLFRHERVGRGGRRFTIFKFRTMYREADAYGVSPGAPDDPRVTPFGRFLRRSSLDELPQFINVLLGQMSLVGPRPEMPFIVEEYTALLRERLSVKPGITGLWQISPGRAFPIHENIDYDLYYVRHRSLFMDAAILLHTLRFLACGI